MGSDGRKLDDILGWLAIATVGVDSRGGKFTGLTVFILFTSVVVDEDIDDGVVERRGANATGTVIGFDSTD